MTVPCLLISLSILAVGLSVTPSTGCGRPAPVDTDALVKRTLSVTSDPHFTNTSRDYTLFLPSEYDPSKPAPMMIWFHGQYGNGHLDAQTSGYTELGKHGLISVYPQGIGFGQGCGTGWNVGSLEPALQETCNLWAGSCCYSSCKEIGVCSSNRDTCGWSTCHDDIAFTRDLIQTLSEELCIDTESLLTAGMSNGGMMQHWIARQMPGVFKSLVPFHGLPLHGMLDVPAANKDTWVLAMNVRTDSIIPDQGGWAGGWHYHSAHEVYSLWAERKGCAGDSRHVSTPFDGGSRNWECREWHSCSHSEGSRLLHCLYDGHHGVYMPQHAEITWWFWAQALGLSA